MNLTAAVINLIAIIALSVAYMVDGQKAIQALKRAGSSFLNILPMALAIVLVIGLLLGFVPPEQISRFVGEQSGLGGVLLVGALGAVLHIPALISFPLAGSLLDGGASIASVAAFITTLTMIGMITLPLEIKELGKEIALLRNGISFIIAIIIALIMGAVL